MLASRFLLNSYICSIQDTRNVHNKSPEQNNTMDTKNPLHFWYLSTCNQFKNINDLFRTGNKIEIKKTRYSVPSFSLKIPIIFWVRSAWAFSARFFSALLQPQSSQTSRSPPRLNHNRHSVSQHLHRLQRWKMDYQLNKHR